MIDYRNGGRGEYIVAKQLRLLNPKEYTCVNNVCLQFGKLTTQIDHIVFSNKAIFVIETKDFNGRVTTSKSSWIQQVNHKRVKFLNPYKQNDYHVDILVNISGIPKNKFRNLVIFTSDSVEILDEFDFGVLTPSSLIGAILNAPDLEVTLREQVTLLQEMKRHLCSTKEHMSRVVKQL